MDHTLYIYNAMLWTMTVMAVMVFIALYFVKAGYGMFRTKAWGGSINNKVAWGRMEAFAVLSDRPSPSGRGSSCLFSG